MPMLVVQKVDEPKPWQSKQGGTFYGFHIHGLLDGKDALGSMNVVKLENVPAVGDSLEVTVELDKYDNFKFKRVQGGQYIRGGMQPALPIGSESPQNGLGSTKVQPVDINAAMARAIEFVTKDPSFAAADGSWEMVEYYTKKALTLQQQLLHQ